MCTVSLSTSPSCPWWTTIWQVRVFYDSVLSNFALDNNLTGLRSSVRAAAAVALATKLLVHFSAEGCFESKVSAVTGAFQLEYFF